MKSDKADFTQGSILKKLVAFMMPVLGALILHPFADPVAIICHDDGKLMGLPLNRALRDENGQMYDAVAGDFLVVGLGEEDFASLTPEMAQKYEQLFHQPEAFLKLGAALDLGIVMLHFSAVASRWAGQVRWELSPAAPGGLPEGLRSAAVYHM